LPASLLILGFDRRAWTGHGDGDAIRESTGRDLPFLRRNQKGFRKGRRKAPGPASSHGKTSASWFREARRCPRAPADAPKDPILLFFSEVKARKLNRRGQVRGGQLVKLTRLAIVDSLKIDDLVKSPSTALRFNFVVAEGRGGSPSRPRSGNPAGCPCHRICAPCL